jgi:hypothetical protein
LLPAGDRKAEVTKVVPWSTALRAKFRANLTPRYRVAVDLGAGCGLRQGEIFGVSPDDIDPDGRSCTSFGKSSSYGTG